MRTTISIEDDVLARAKAKALERKCTLGDLVNEALLLSLSTESRVRAKSPFRLTTVKGNGPAPGVKLNDNAALLDWMEEHPNVTILSPGGNHWEIFRRLCREGDATGNRIPDAYHAALAVETGCEWISADRGFSRYPGLKWSHPLTTP
jgi:hypothetical protein